MAGSQAGSFELDLFKQTTVKALNVASVRILEDHLNANGKMVELSDGSGLKVCDNYTGLAEQDNFSPGDISELMEFSSPTRELITEMADRSRTVEHLSRYLLNMGRTDVIKRSHNNWVKDCRLYAKTREEIEENEEYIQKEKFHEDQHPYHLEDKPGNTKQFDAFLSYAYPDLQIAKKMIRKLENRGYHLFVPGRDDLPGEAKYVLTAYVIEKRCRRVIILLTSAFGSSPECDFQLKFSNALDPGASEMKIIPVICEKNVDVPPFLNFIHTCDITKNQWPNLYKALSHKRQGQNTKVLETLTYPPPAVVVNKLKKEQAVGKRFQPDGDSGAVCDGKPLDYPDSGAVCRRKPLNDVDSGAVCDEVRLDDSDSGVVCDRRPLEDQDSGDSCQFYRDESKRLGGKFTRSFREGLSFLNSIITNM